MLCRILIQSQSVAAKIVLVVPQSLHQKEHIPIIAQSRHVKSCFYFHPAIMDLFSTVLSGVPDLTMMNFILLVPRIFVLMSGRSLSYQSWLNRGLK